MLLRSPRTGGVQLDQVQLFLQAFERGGKCDIRARNQPDSAGTAHADPAGTKQGVPATEMRKLAKRLINGPLGLMGYRVVRHPHPGFTLGPVLAHLQTDLLFDVGANKGQFASELRKDGYHGRIVCFEPLPDAHAELTRRFAKVPEVQVHERVALGAAPGLADMNVSGNSVSSSLREMLPSHLEIAPGSAYVSAIKTTVAPLDAIAGRYMNGARSVFLKIDTQGFEGDVLDGAEETLAAVDGVQLELSLLPLYEGQDLWSKLSERLIAAGFVLWQIQPEGFSPQNGRTLWFNGVFVRARFAG